MTSGTGSISLSGLLGGTAGQIDTTSLIASLMQAQAIPQNQLKDQVTAQQKVITNYQGINSLLATLATAAQAVTDPDSWAVTSATSSNAAVIASTSAGALAGTSTFHVAQLATTQVSTVAADSNGIVVDTPANGITITGSDGTAHQISLTSGNATDVAAAINKAGVGVRAAVVTTDSGQVLQLSATNPGTNSAFTAAGFGDGSVGAQNIVTAQNAQISVGNPAAGGYTISSQTNTFANAIPGVTFSIGADAVGSDVTISVSDDVNTISNTVQAMVTAANAAKTGINQVTGQGGILQGYSDVTTIGSDLSSAISMGTSNGKSLTEYGVDIDSTGVMSFDATQFAAAYAADPQGTMAAISGSLGTTFSQIATNASAPTTGSLSQTITSMNSHVDDLNTQISNWDDRLNTIQTQLTLKYTTMQTALAKLQSQGDWLTSMFKSLQNNNSDSSS